MRCKLQLSTAVAVSTIATPHVLAVRRYQRATHDCHGHHANKGLYSSSSSSSPSSSSSSFATTTTATHDVGDDDDDDDDMKPNNKQQLQQPDHHDSSTSFTKLRQVSNFASFLCALDCTVLPAVTVALPILGLLDLNPGQLAFFHHVGHQLALYFVLPIGGTTTVVNYLSHKKVSLTALGSLGLCTIGLANYPIPASSLPTTLWGGYQVPMEFWQNLQHGPLHRVVNTTGCGCLLTSNYLSQRVMGCSHHHHHHHDHHGSSSTTTSSCCRWKNPSSSHHHSHGA